MKVNTRFCLMPVERNFVVQIVKLNNETFRIEFTPHTATQALKTLGRWASNPDLNFTWWDAACLSNRIAKLLREVECSGK